MLGHYWGRQTRIHREPEGKILEYLDQNSKKLQDSRKIVDLSLFMLGNSPLQAKPTIMFVSEDKKAQKEAFKIVKESNILMEHPRFEPAHIPLTTEFENLGFLANHGADFPRDASAMEEGLKILSPQDSQWKARRLYFYTTPECKDAPQVATAGGRIYY